MSTINIEKEALRAQISNLKSYLDDIQDVQDKLENAINVFEDQDSPKAIGSIKDVLQDFKKDVANLSADKLGETIKMIGEGVEAFEESDNNLKTNIENM